MPNILTPLSLWSSFDDSLDIYPEILSVVDEDDIRVEKLYFLGRETAEGRVKIAAYYARNLNGSAAETILILPDSRDGFDLDLMKYFVKHGYAVLMADYRGKREGSDFYTEYPEDVSYANADSCGRYKDFVDESADKTSWYEWVAVGIYARKYIIERTHSEKIAVVGIRDGGEIAWKLGVAASFSCIIPVSAAGWLAYAGLNKHVSEDITLNEERYRFIAGIDSQAYAPYVKCPVLLLCTTNDPRFDYDRAYDTYSRINEKFISDSSIAYSIHNSNYINPSCTQDMFLFLDKHLKNRQIFLPNLAQISVEVDAKDNLIAKVNVDDNGIMVGSALYLAEDNVDSAMRDWISCPMIRNASAKEQEFLLNIYEKTSMIFAICGVQYSNGFTVWSKIAVKKISGSFRNMQTKSRVIYSNANKRDGFTSIPSNTYSIGNIFNTDNYKLPELVVKEGVEGLYSMCGLSTFRTMNPRFSPVPGSMLYADVYSDEDSELTLTFTNVNTEEEYSVTVSLAGGAWQTFVGESKLFKTPSGIQLPEFTAQYSFSINCTAPFAVNNILWL